MGLLTQEHLDTIGTSEPSVDVYISRRDIQKYSAATEQQQAKYINGDEAPPMFIFNLFAPVSTLSDIRADGLARNKVVGPKLPLKRIMAGGTEIKQHLPIIPGDCLTGTRKITDMYEKQGSSGPLIFTVRSLIITDNKGALVMEEIQTSIAR
jgi:3-methylfumaryl-CoA hydratase